MLRVKYWVLCALVLVSFAHEKCRADDAVRSVNGAVQTHSAPAKMSDEQLTSHFYRALNAHAKGELSPERAFSPVREAAREQGYENLSAFSQELLGRAAQAAAQGKADEAQQLTEYALRFSPRDPYIAFAAASLAPFSRLAQAWSYAAAGVKQLPSHPLLLAGAGVNLIFALLVSATVALFIVTMVQLVRSIELVLDYCLCRFRARRRVVFGRLLAVLLLVGPLFLGILGALGCWSVLLGRVKNSCRALAWFAALLVFAWAAAVAAVSQVGFNACLPANRAVEQIANRSFSPGSQALLQQGLQRNPADVPLLFAHAVQLHSRQLQREAKVMYEQVLALVDANSPLRQAVTFNLAVAAYEDQRYEEARESLLQLEAAGEESFELYYNLALAYLVTLDMPNYRLYYAKAKDADSARLEQLQEASQSSKPLLRHSLPAASYVELLFRSPAQQGPEIAYALDRKKQQLAAAMLVVPSAIGLSAFGICLVLSALSAGVFAAPRAGHLGRTGRPSLIWLMLPGGLELAGERPGYGALLLTLMIAPLVIGLNYPVRLYNLLLTNGSFAPPALGLSALLFILTTLLGLYMHQRHGGGG